MIKPSENMLKCCRVPVKLVPLKLIGLIVIQLYFSEPSPESLAHAKRNIAKHYAVVGVSEQLTEFMEVLEWMFPAHFPGVLKVHKQSGKSK